MTTFTTVGQPVGRPEADKVTGAATYVADIRLPGMLFGKVLRSPHPHARIVSIDATAARLAPGVRAVLTGRDIPYRLVGRRLRDMPVLARDVVLFQGQKVAAVAAETPEAAETALGLIAVEYEELPFIDDVLDALKPDAPVLHPDYNSYEGKPKPQDTPSNVVSHHTWGRGDVDAAFAQADRVYEHTFRTGHQHQGYLEPHACIVSIDADGHVDLWINSKTPFMARQQLSWGTDVPEEKITVRPALIGGDFGGKGSFMDSHVAYFLARATGRPVRMAMDYVEELMAADPRHPSTITFRTGVRRDGTILARQMTGYFDSGAFGGFKPGAGATYASVRRAAAGPYRVPAWRVDAFAVYTNHVPAGSMRAPWDPQHLFASESQIDIVARDLGMDPYEFRLKNLVGPDEENALGHHWRANSARQVLEAAAREGRYHEPRPRGVGRGLAMSERHVGGGESTARVIVGPDGSVTVRSAMVETGTGAWTVVRQIVAEELGAPLEQVRLVPWTTDETKFDAGAGGSRVTHVAGQAALQAARAVREQLARFAADLAGWPQSQVTFRGGMVGPRSSDGTRLRPGAVTLGSLVSRAGAPVEAERTYRSEVDEDVTCFTAQCAEVAVDEETGQVRLTGFATVHDVGTVINPVAHQSQIEGAVMQGVGFALMEEIRYEDGRVTTLSLGEYKVPTMRDIPGLRSVLVPGATGPGPYAAKAIGEQPVGPVAAAIANAVADAAGVRVTALPITAEKVYRLLRGR